MKRRADREKNMDPAGGPPRGAARHFFVALGVIIALIVSSAFGGRIAADVMRAEPARPAILYVHVALSGLWVALFLVQAALVDTRHLAWHRTLGAAGLVAGAAVPVVGAVTAVVMARYHLARGEESNPATVIGPLFDMGAFALAVGLAGYWRSRPDRHRRLMLVATCILTIAAFPRLPAWVTLGHASLGAPALIAAGLARDIAVLRRVHPVYLFALPLLLLGNAAVGLLSQGALPAWNAIAQSLVQ